MNVLLDSNVPRSLQRLLIENGHRVEHVDDVLPSGTTDERVAGRALGNRAILVSRDFDFADVRVYPPADYLGIVVMSLPKTMSPSAMARRTYDAMAGIGFDQLSGLLVIVELHRVRTRRS